MKIIVIVTAILVLSVLLTGTVFANGVCQSLANSTWTGTYTLNAKNYPLTVVVNAVTFSQGTAYLFSGTINDQAMGNDYGFCEQSTDGKTVTSMGFGNRNFYVIANSITTPTAPAAISFNGLYQNGPIIGTLSISSPKK